MLALLELERAAVDHPLRVAWLNLEMRVALVQAARAVGHEADLQALLARELGAKRAADVSSGPASLEERERRWRLVAQRKGSPELRGWVAKLAPSRADTLPVEMATAIRQAVADVAAFARTPFITSGATGRAGGRPGDRKGEGRAAACTADDGRPDMGDLVMAMPFALRRARFIRIVVPSLSGRVELLRRRPDDEDDGGAVQRERLLEIYAEWLRSLQRDAREATARLRLLNEHAASAMRRMEGLRRPAAMRRLLALSLARPGLWATRLAELSHTNVSSAWRLLVQAEELGIVARVPTTRRSRGDGVMFASPVHLRLAGLVSVPAAKGRPAAIRRDLRPSGGLSALMAEFDSLMAEMDGAFGLAEQA